VSTTATPRRPRDAEADPQMDLPSLSHQSRSSPLSDPPGQTDAGETALYVAMEANNEEVVRLLLLLHDFESATIRSRLDLDASHVTAKQGHTGELPISPLLLMLCEAADSKPSAPHRGHWIAEAATQWWHGPRRTRRSRSRGSGRWSRPRRGGPTPSRTQRRPPFLYEEENYQSKIETTLTYGPYYSHWTPKYFLLGFISCALLLGFTTSLAIFLRSVNFSTVECPTPPVSSSASSPPVYSLTST
jgi:hypothetical protein